MFFGFSGKLMLYFWIERMNPMSELNLTQENFDREVLRADKPVLVDFWADWCGPCRALSPVISQIANEYQGKVLVGKVNVDEQPQLAEQYGVAGIPTVMLFKNGEVVQSAIGARPKAELEAMLH